MHLLSPTLGVASYGWKLAIAMATLGAAIGYFWWWPASLPLFILAGYVLYFFRDPSRRAPGIPNSICSPADGRVASVMEVACPEMPDGKAQRIAIFLNIFNVHVQRIPYAGTVRSIVHRPGKCINALNEKCSEENEAVTVWLDTELGPVGVRQITGAIARRIVCAAREGVAVERGARYGIIQFGSRVELFLPGNCAIKVVPGQKVIGALTCVAIAHEAEVRKGRSLDEIRRDLAVAGQQT
jgi:phosphatidylserine decarboxylase